MTIRVNQRGDFVYRFTSQFAALLGAAVLLVSISAAQSPASADPTATAASAATKSAKPKKPFTPKSAKGKECSAKADAQSLRGKARKKFRADCMKAA
jgi:hypothetical protein